MLELEAPPTRRPPARPRRRSAPEGIRRPRRRGGRGGQSAGQILAVMLGALVLAALVNADALVERAERKPFGPARDRSLMLWHPVQDVAHITQLHRLRTLGDLLVGDDDPARRPEEPATAHRPVVPEPAAVEPPELRRPTAADPWRVYIGGDSVVRDAGESFLRLTADDPLLRTTLHYEIATGLSRPDFYDWPGALRADAAELKPDIALIMFGGNDAQGIVGPGGEVFQHVDTPGWRAEYGRRVGAVMDELAAEGRIVLWVGQPPMRDAGFDARIAVIDSVVREQAEKRPWVTYVDTAKVLGDPNGRYTDRRPDADGALRQPDGIHLSRTGADLLARHLLSLVQGL